MRIVIGLLGIALGALITIKHAWIVQNFGHIATVERYMRTFGGTRLFLILLGVLISIISLLYMTGVFPGVIGDIFLGAFGR